MKDNPHACPSCGCKGPHPVVNTIHRSFSFRGRLVAYTRRRKVCRHCGLPYWTKEMDEETLDEIIQEVQDPPEAPEIPPDLLG